MGIIANRKEQKILDRNSRLREKRNKCYDIERVKMFIKNSANVMKRRRNGQEKSMAYRRESGSHTLTNITEDICCICTL